MFGKSALGLSVLGVVGAYFMQAGGYKREVGATPEAVRGALYSLDITSAPGAPGSDPANSAGLRSNFAVTQEGEDMVWTVTNGNEVAVRLIAHLEPTDGGAHTIVTTRYERGNAPDDHVAPAFRSKGISLGLFAAVLEDKLDDLVMPAGAWTEKCDAIVARLEDANIAAGGMERSQSFGDAFARTSRVAMNLAAFEKELRAAGCPTEKSGTFREVSNVMGDGGRDSIPPEAPDGPVAGKPMVDLDRYR